VRVTNRDDEIIRLILRILELRAKINAQIDGLNNTIIPTRKTTNNDPEKREPDIEEELKWLLKTRELQGIPSDLRPKTNHDEADHDYGHKEELKEWGLATGIHEDELPRDELQQCRECRYKEGLEEVLNVLSICGFIRRDEKKRGTGTQGVVDDLNLPQLPRGYVSKCPISAFYY